MRSKVIIVLASLLAAGVLPSAAQISVGALGGLNMARLSYDPDAEIDLSGRTGVGAGAVFELGLGEDSALQIEPMFLQKGGVRTADGVDNEISLSFLEVPLLLRLRLSKAATTPYLLAGPSFGYVLDAKVKATENGVTSEQSMKDDVKSLDFTLTFGAGVNVGMGKNAFFLEARYALGSTDINDRPGTTNPVVKTRGILVFAGYTFLIREEADR